MNLFRFFKKRQRQIKPAPVLFGQVADQVERAQRRMAAFLQQRTAKFSKRTLYVLLVLFCLGYSSLCLFVLLQKERGMFQSIYTSPPEHIGRASAARMSLRDSVHYERLKAFARYLDSLQRTSSGKRIYDSLVSRRPGLVDSLHAALP